MSLSFKSATETTATVHFSVTFNLPASTYDTEWYGQIGNQYISSSANSMGYGGDVTVTNLTRGSANVITGSMRCDYAYYGVTAEGIPVKQIGYETVTFESLIVYTHPGPFNIGASAVSSSSNNIIANVLTADKINNEWIPHFQKAYHWKKQHQSGYINGTDYNPAKNYYSPNPQASNESTSGLMVKQNDPIYAAWFNNCMTAMRLLGKTNNETEKVNGGSSGTTISAKLINQLNFSGTN